MTNYFRSYSTISCHIHHLIIYEIFIINLLFIYLHRWWLTLMIYKKHCLSVLLIHTFVLRSKYKHIKKTQSCFHYLSSFSCPWSNLISDLFLFGSNKVYPSMAGSGGKDFFWENLRRRETLKLYLFIYRLYFPILR